MIGQLWTQASSVSREYGRLTLATAGLLFRLFTSQYNFHICIYYYYYYYYY